MSLFDWLLVGHLVGDWLVQTEPMALAKVKDRHVRFWHAMIWSFCVWLSMIGWATLTPHLSRATMFPAAPEGIGVALFLFLGHYWLDSRVPVLWWRKHISLAAKADEPQWVVFVHDQVWHVLQLVVVTLVLAR